MHELTDLRAAVVGTGFIGVVHVAHKPDFPTFADGHRANVLGDVVAASAREQRWVEVPA